LKTSWNNGGSILVRVGPHHFAFLRGYFEGLPLATLSKRYLETAIAPDPDLRIAKSTLKWIREQLMVAARRRGMFAEARLVLLDPDKLRSEEKRAVPTLEEFREIRDPHELFSEAELIELFHEEYGNNAHTDRRTTRNERLRRKQVTALLELEKLLGSPPAPSDDVAGWLHPVLAGRLRNAGLTTLGELVTTVNARGYRWWTQVPRFGEKAAAQVVAWLGTELTARGLGMQPGIQATTRVRKIPPDVLASQRPRQFGMVPLEYLQLPPSLDGAGAGNRGAHCSIAASNDIEAVRLWLATKEDGSHTWRSYRKEAERLLLWATLERGKSLSALSAEDCRDYLDFLALLGTDEPDQWPFRLPRWEWIAPRGTKRWSPLWRPFEGGLSVESRRLAATILALMGRWLVCSGYWAANPWEGVQAEPARRQPQGMRGFSETEWLVMQRHLEPAHRHLKADRLRFLLRLCRETEMRLSELAHARREDLRLAGHALADGGFIKIRIGARKGKELPVSGKLLHELDTYLARRGQGGVLAAPPSTPLIGRLPRDTVQQGSGDRISPNGLYFVLKEFFASVAEQMENDGESGASGASVFRLASTRWLRSLSLPAANALTA
jgi:integrase